MLLTREINSGVNTKIFVFTVVCCLLSVICFAQLNFDFQKDKFLIKGKVVELQSKTAIPSANIRVNGNGKGLTCDNEGNFTFYVYKSDTLRFSSTGYLPKVIHVYDLDSTGYYTLEIQLIHDFIKLKDVTIYPFKNKEEFVDAFLDAKGVNKVDVAGIAPPKYGTVSPKAKFSNPISMLYERVKKRRVADPDFRP
ncbi:MAG: carboxypeptidase-like regulatory domain-containing protein [Bacteroidota bacterium]